MSNKFSFPCSVSNAIDLDVSVVATYQDRSLLRLFILPEVKHKHFITFALSADSLLDLVILDDVPQLWENCGTALGYSTCLSFRNLPNRDVTIVITA